MKKVALAVLVAGFVASGASAGTLWMQFAGGLTEITLHPSETADVEIYFDLSPTDPGVAGLATPFEALITDGLDVTDIIPKPPGWGSSSTLGPWGNGAYVNVGGDPLEEPSNLLADVIIHQNWLNVGETFELKFLYTGLYPSITKPNGQPYALDPRYSASYSGYYTFGAGAPHVTAKKWEVLADPLIVHCVPEPGALALLVLGGLVGLRRRS